MYAIENAPVVGVRPGAGWNLELPVLTRISYSLSPRGTPSFPPVFRKCPCPKGRARRRAEPRPGRTRRLWRTLLQRGTSMWEKRGKGVLHGTLAVCATPPSKSGYRVVHGLATQRCQNRSSRRPRPQHTSNSRYDACRGDYPRPNGSQQTVGWHSRRRAERKVRTSPPRRTGNRSLHRSRPGSDAMGGSSGIQRRSGTRRLHLCSAVCTASGDQRPLRRVL